MRRYTFILFVLIALMLGLYFGSIAQAIPTGQKDCETNAVNTSSTSFVIVPNSSVTVNNGNTARQCVIQFSTEVRTSVGDQTFLRYTIDSTNPANCNFIGPEFFHAGESNLIETHTQMGVRNIGAGTHTIRPCFSANDGNLDGATSTFFIRCMTVECRTQ
jgi:hypothetical protein